MISINTFLLKLFENLKTLLFCLLVSTCIYAQDVRVNEIMALNTSTYTDNDGQASDWIELRNLTSSDFDLAGYYITDNPNNLTKHRFSLNAGELVIPANGYLLLWASGNVGSGNYHLGFSLSSTDGETVILVAPDQATILDQFDFPPQKANISIGKSDENRIKYYSPSSPGIRNNEAHALSVFLSAPVFSHQGGFFSSNFNLRLSHDEIGVTIYYTLDGSEPNPANLNETTYQYKQSFPGREWESFGNLLSRSYRSHVYMSEIAISDRSSSSNEISNINTTVYSNPTHIPDFNVKKGTVVRAIAVKDGYQSSDIVSNTYIYSATGRNPYTFPISSVVTQENNLFDYETGIYTAGKVFDEHRRSNPSGDLDWCTTANFTQRGSSWQRSANFEFFDNNESKVNQLIGLRLHGGCTTVMPYKSLRLYGANRFDEHAFFDENPNLYHSRLIIRNSGNDQTMTFFKDAFSRELVKDMKIGTQKTKNTILFLNGEYWGIHNIRERIDKYYLKELYKIDSENIDLREFSWNTPPEMSEGDDVHFIEMYNYIINNNLAVPSNYNHVKTLLDVDSFADFFIAQTFLGNIDWPQNNVRSWRTKNAYNPNGNFSDGRWRYIVYDIDRGLGELQSAGHNYLEEAITKTNNESSEIVRRLLSNTEFKNMFINRYADMLNTVFSPSFSVPLFTKMKNEHQPEVEEHIQRWKTHDNSVMWEEQCDIVESYINIRKQFLYEHLDAIFEINGTYDLTVSSQNIAYGHVNVNTIEIDNQLTRGVTLEGNNWTGKYFRNIPIVISAIPKKGYKFMHWQHNGNIIYTKDIEITTFSDIAYEAFFEYTGVSDNPFPLAADIKECSYKLDYWSENAQAGSFPLHGAFIYMDEENPESSALGTELKFTTGPYNLTSGTRINGLNEGGFSFINTGGGDKFPSSRLGGFVLAINTLDLDNVSISWSAKTIVDNPRNYKIRLAYRVGDIGDFSPLGSEYTSGLAEHFADFPKIRLPEEAVNKPYVQLVWQYYDTRTVNSGARDQIAITQIRVQRVAGYASIKVKR